MKRCRGKILLMLCPLALTACGSIRPPQPPSLDLPNPPSDLRATRKGDNVILTWTVPTKTTDRQIARSFGATQVCRTLQPILTKCGTPVGEAAPLATAGKNTAQKLTATDTDTLPASMLGDNPANFATYAVEVLNVEGHGAGLSNPAHVLLAHTLAPPQDFSARVSAKGVVLTWTSNAPSSPPAGLRYVYRVFRREEGSRQPVSAGEVTSDTNNKLSITDSSFEWEKTYEYHVEAVTLIEQPGRAALQVEGEDTPEVKVFADDVFPPAVPAGLQAAFSGPGQQTFIDLIWAPDSDADLDGYNVYRHEEAAAPMKLNSELVKTPAYRDLAVSPGKHYFYSVTAVDLRGNESAHSEQTDESVP